jgi:predicted TIM-barrel fold metal-dependent hydrolase
MSDSSVRKIDVHAHYLPDGYADAMRKGGITNPDGMPGYPKWSPELALETYEKLGIATGILSISSPGVHYGDDAAARGIARMANEAGAELAVKYPGRFGLFAALPMPDVDGSLEELAYAMDVLHADGVGLKTNAHGIYLGDPKFDPIFQELNRRKTVVFIHPTSPFCSQHCAMGYPLPMLEFPFETARAVTNLIFSGTLERYPDLSIIIPHSGGTVPVLAARIAAFGHLLNVGTAGTKDAITYLRGLYYDTAMSATNYSLASLRQLADISHIVYGSDWPWCPEAQALKTNRELEASSFFSEQDREMIYRSNPLRLLPRLKA